jgi:hypothetical protein
LDWEKKEGALDWEKKEEGALDWEGRAAAEADITCAIALSMSTMARE